MSLEANEPRSPGNMDHAPDPTNGSSVQAVDIHSNGSTAAPIASPRADVELSQGSGEPLDDSNAEELSTPKRTIHDLRMPPPFLAEMRWRLFEVREPIELKIDEFERYWPYTDNVWVRQHRAGTDKSGRVTTDYYACRLQRPTYTPRKSDPSRPEGKPPLRKKQTREGGTCQMRIKTVRIEGACPKYSITKVGDHEHTHDLDHMDRIKRNTVVMEIAKAEVMKGFMPASVFTIMSEDQVRLAAAGGRYLNRNDVRNASQIWRRTHGDQLAVHPGYKYDHGNGIVRNDDSAAVLTANGSHSLPILDPALTDPTPIPSSLPPNTLYFPPASRDFLNPYLPPFPQPTHPLSIPYITLTYATSLDSFLAIAPGVPTALSSPASKAMTHYLRTRHDALLVGVGTVLADNPTLNARLHLSGGHGGVGWDGQPRPIVIDPGARWVITPQSAVLQAVAAGRGKAPWVIIAPGCSVDPARLELLRFYGGKYLGLPDLDEGSRLSWEAVFRALAAEGIRSVMVEGGGVVINELLQPEYRPFVSSVVLTVAPTYLGTGGVVVCPTRNVDGLGRPKAVARFRDVRWEQVGEDVVMCGRLGGGEGEREREDGAEVGGVAGVAAQERGQGPTLDQMDAQLQAQLQGQMATQAPG